MAARTENDEFFLLTFGMPLTSGGIAFAIETTDSEIMNDLVDFIFMYDDKNIYEISKLIKEKVFGLDRWCRVRMLNELDYEIVENTHPRDGVNIRNLNLLDELAGSYRSLEDLHEQKQLKIVGFRKDKDNSIVPYISTGGEDRHVDESKAKTVVSNAMSRLFKT